MCETPEQAKELAATLARQVNDACNPPATGSTPELERLIKQALPGFDYLLMLASDQLSEEIVAHWKQWADNVTAALDAPATGSTPAPDDDGWIPWSGGNCPVGCKTLVNWKVRHGVEGNEPSDAGRLRWDHSEGPYDIIAYRISK